MRPTSVGVRGHLPFLRSLSGFFVCHSEATTINKSLERLTYKHANIFQVSYPKKKL
ncbi:hypothetical protein Mapa_011785 [Marchantia paleacea]|nr:hypothetical protein Mapa_011785 [Marchantia paleacea]